ncbi:MAG: serine/threonine protein kinase, partial [Planctomycetota bacterium]
MKKQLGKFHLLEQIDPGGYTIVYRAEEEMGQGFTRPSAVKILRGMDRDDEAKIAVLRRETEMLVELSTCPNIVTIYGIGIDEEMGPWIAMELLGRSLKHFVGDEPAEPDQVRIMLRDALRALSVVHGVEPPILHRDLKPNNILSTDFGNWVIADFGLARRWEADDTLHLATVQYAAPELLDTSLGSETVKMDLYSLGMVAYEYALGQRLYRKQFPSVYDPYASKAETGDERPKWMYWHTSMQMAVPPIAELIADYPQDLSDLVAAMTVKPLAERLGTAGEALGRLGRVEGTMVLPVEEKVTEDELVPQRWRVPALAALAVIVLLIVFAASYYVIRSGGRPRVELDEMYSGTRPIMIAGRIERFPGRGSAMIALPDGSSFPVYVDDEGAFSSEVLVDELGETRGFLKVLDKTGREVALKTLKLERIPPEAVQLTLATYPAVPRAEVVITRHNEPDQPIRLRTDQAGVARATVPYGGFDLAVAHPRYRPLANSFKTGIDPEKSITARLDEIPLYEIYAEMKELIDRIRALAMRKANCPPGPLGDVETRQLDESMARLGDIYDADPDVELFMDAVRRVEECNPESFAAVEEAAAQATAAIAAKEEALPDELRDPAAVAAGSGRDARGRRGGGPGTGGPGGEGGPFGSQGGAGGAGVLGDQAVAKLIEDIVARAGGAAAVDPAVVAALMNMSLDEFTSFVEKHVPIGALEVEAVPRLNKVRLKGALFNESELERLVLRLLAAMGRLQIELRIDAWDLCRHLEERLEALGAEDVRVHAYLAPDDDTIFVQFTKGEALDRATA